MQNDQEHPDFPLLAGLLAGQPLRQDQPPQQIQHHQQQQQPPQHQQPLQQLQPQQPHQHQQYQQQQHQQEPQHQAQHQAQHQQEHQQPQPQAPLYHHQLPQQVLRQQSRPQPPQSLDIPRPHLPQQPRDQLQNPRPAQRVQPQPPAPPAANAPDAGIQAARALLDLAEEQPPPPHPAANRDVQSPSSSSSDTEEDQRVPEGQQPHQAPVINPPRRPHQLRYAPYQPAPRPTTSPAVVAVAPPGYDAAASVAHQRAALGREIAQGRPVGPTPVPAYHRDYLHPYAAITYDMVCYTAAFAQTGDNDVLCPTCAVQRDYMLRPAERPLWRIYHAISSTHICSAINCSRCQQIITCSRRAIDCSCCRAIAIQRRGAVRHYDYRVITDRFL